MKCNVQVKHLTSSYLKTGPQTDAHPKETDPNGLYYPFGSEGSRAEGRERGRLPGRERAAGRPPPPGAPVARRLTRAARRRPRQRRDEGREPDHASDGTSREPEHALEKTGHRLFLHALEPIPRNYFSLRSSRSVLQMRPMLVRRLPSLGGWGVATPPS